MTKFKKGEICIVNDSGAKTFNKYSDGDGGVSIKVGDKIVCMESDDVPYCTPLNVIEKDNATRNEIEVSTWALTRRQIESTGEFMELDQ